MLAQECFQFFNPPHSHPGRGFIERVRNYARRPALPVFRLAPGIPGAVGYVIMTSGRAIRPGLALVSMDLRAGVVRVGVAGRLVSTLVAVIAEPFRPIRGAFFGALVFVLDDICVLQASSAANRVPGGHEIANLLWRTDPTFRPQFEVFITRHAPHVEA
jgi:hypothetical protein